MSRLVPFRSKASDAVRQRIEMTQTTTMYLVQTTGPTSYVVQEQNCDKKHKVLIGALQSCSCGDADVCIHILFVMLKVLRVPTTTSIVWQKSLIDSEIDGLLRGDYRENTRAPPPKNMTGFLKKQKQNAGSAQPQTDVEVNEAQRHELVEGEVCAICQEDMTADQPLTFCRKGCGNNFHIECMKVFGESRKQSKEHLICPLCRHDWGDLALTELKKEMDVANKAPNVHKGVTCKKCQIKPIRNERYRCIQCKNADLCDRCFKMNAHITHNFVMKKLVTDAWIPALRTSQHRLNAASSELVEELQNRDLTTNDYDLLLQLDQRDKFPLQDYLLSTLGGQRVVAANTKSFGEPGATCAVCRQSLRIQADVRSVICGVRPCRCRVLHRALFSYSLDALAQHAFHESCLSRSVLSQVYVCPHPGCEHVLFPGMHQLVVKAKAPTANAVNQRNSKPTASNVMNVTLSVMAIQHTEVVSVNGPRCEKQTKPVSKLPKQVPARPTLQDFASLSIGFASSSQTQEHHLPPLQQPSSRNGSRQLERPTKGTSSRTQQHPRADSTSHPNNSPPMGQDPVSADERLKHAEQLRAELKNLDKARHRKQRLEREKRVRKNVSNNDSNHEALNSLLPTIGHTTNFAKPNVPGSQESRRPTASQQRHRKCETRTSPSEVSSGNSIEGSVNLPELSIGTIRRA